LRLLSRYIFLLGMIILSTLSACKSTKYGLVKRTFHNITAHYNGYFNAKQRVDNTEMQNNKAFRDKYEDILPVFKLERDDDPTTKTSFIRDSTS